METDQVNIILSLLFYYIDDLSDFNTLKRINNITYSQSLTHHQRLYHNSKIWQKETKKLFSKPKNTTYQEMSLEQWIEKKKNNDSKIPYIETYLSPRHGQKGVRFKLKRGMINNEFKGGYADYLFQNEPLDWRMIYLHIRLIKKIVLFHYDKLRSKYVVLMEAGGLDSVEIYLYGPFKCEYGVKVGKIIADFDLRGDNFGIGEELELEEIDWESLEMLVEDD